MEKQKLEYIIWNTQKHKINQSSPVLYKSLTELKINSTIHNQDPPKQDSSSSRLNCSDFRPKNQK